MTSRDRLVEVCEFVLPDHPPKSALMVVPFVAVGLVARIHAVQPRLTAATVASWFGAFAALALVHELCHATGMRLAGARPQFGFRFRALQPCVLAEGFQFRQRDWMRLTVAPLVVTVPAAAVLLAFFPTSPWALVVFVLAPLGCATDLRMMLHVHRQALPGDYVEDRAKGFAILRSVD